MSAPRKRAPRPAAAGAARAADACHGVPPADEAHPPIHRADADDADARTTVSWHLYLLLCRNGSYYAGITNNLDARFQAHLSGKGARYTRANPPLRILASCLYPDRASASRAEWQLKQLPRPRKLDWLLQQTGNAAACRLAIEPAERSMP